MGLIGRVLSFLRVTKANGARVSFTKFAANNEPTLRGQHFGAPGDDGAPLAGDYVYSGRGPRTGEWVALGYLDGQSAPKAGQGDRRIYSRSGPGTLAAEVWLQADGTVFIQNDAVGVALAPGGSASMSNDNGSIQMQSSGNVVINGVTIDTNGNISTAGTIEGAGVTDSNSDVTLGTHNHPSDGAPPTPGS